jgi:hypothetical protein
LKPENLDPNQISGADMKKVEALKRAVSEGNYVVSAEDLTPKLMESMFRNTVLDEAPNGASSSQLGTEQQPHPENHDTPETPGGTIVNRKDSRSA